MLQWCAFLNFYIEIFFFFFFVNNCFRNIFLGKKKEKAQNDEEQQPLLSDTNVTTYSDKEAPEKPKRDWV